jgi:hypothetical protein
MVTFSLRYFTPVVSPKVGKVVPLRKSQSDTPLFRFFHFFWDRRRKMLRFVDVTTCPQVVVKYAFEPRVVKWKLSTTMQSTTIILELIPPQVAVKMMLLDI